MPTLMAQLINEVNDCRTAYGARKYGPHQTYGPTTTIGSVLVEKSGAISLIHRTDDDGAIFSCYVQGNGGKQCSFVVHHSPVLLMSILLTAVLIVVAHVVVPIVVVVDDSRCMLLPRTRQHRFAQPTKRDSIVHDACRSVTTSYL